MLFFVVLFNKLVMSGLFHKFTGILIRIEIFIRDLLYDCTDDTFSLSHSIRQLLRPRVWGYLIIDDHVHP